MQYSFVCDSVATPDRNYYTELSEFVHCIVDFLFGSKFGAKTTFILCCVDGELRGVIDFQLDLLTRFHVYGCFLFSFEC